MIPRCVALTALISMAASPAAADTFYIVQDKERKVCTAVREKPTSADVVLVGDGSLVFTSHDNAEAAIDKTPECARRRQATGDRRGTVRVIE